MSKAVLKISFCQLRSGVDLHDLSTSTGKTWSEILYTVGNAPVPGSSCPAWGQELGEPNNIRSFSCWDDIGVHAETGKHMAQQRLTELFTSIISGTPEAYYAGVDVDFYKSLVRKRAIIEVINLCFPPDAEDEIAQGGNKLKERSDEIDKLNKNGFYVSSWGWSIEMGRRQKGWAMIAGWRDITSCTKSRGSPESKASIEELMKTPGIIKFESYMAPLQAYPGE